jgi:membrane-associated phospholipid phosphatase
MRARGSLVLGLSILARSLPAGADESATQPLAQPTSEERAKEEARAKLVEKILTSDADDRDLAWLYSRADEYAPSDLTGEPILAPGLPERGEGSPRHWDSSWRKFGTANYVLTGVAIGTSAGSLLVPSPKNPWQRTNQLDEWGRRHISVDDYEAGHWAKDTSDLLLSMNIAFPLLVDSLIVAYWYRRSPEVAGQTALIAVEAMAIASALQGVASAAFGRERPYGRDCGTSIPSELSECSSNDRYRSFFSGHATMGFAAATVTCTNHAMHDLFGDPAADALACAGTLATAATVATMRVVALKHYLTDVATGAAVGTLTGLGVPWLLHYGPLARVAPEAAGVSFTVLPHENGLAIGGVF